MSLAELVWHQWPLFWALSGVLEEGVEPWMFCQCFQAHSGTCRPVGKIVIPAMQSRL
jgi:hypothetical protein